MRKYLISAAILVFLISCNINRNNFNLKIYKDIINCNSINDTSGFIPKPSQWRRIHSVIYYDIRNAFGYYSSSDILFRKKTRPLKWGENRLLYSDGLMYCDFLSQLDYSITKDTVYMMELYSFQGECFFSVWTGDKMLSYKDKKLMLVDDNQSSFSKYMRKLVSDWNIAEIRREGLINQPLPQEEIRATRIIFNKGKYQIDCFSFLDFYDPERDWSY